MPLPPRDLTGLHVSLNPSLHELHAAYPLSRFVPCVAAFRLFKMQADGVPLAAHLDAATWLTLACLDDQAADYCLGCALWRWQHGGDRHAVNASLVHAAAPFVVPMMCAAPPAYGPPAYAQAPSAPRAPTPRVARPATAESAAPQPRQPQQAPPRGVAAFPGAVARVASALVRDARGKVDDAFFDDHGARLRRLSASTACKALREFAGRLRETDAADAAKALADVLRKYET